MLSESVKKRAVQMREAGYSYGYISKHTAVSKSTLSTWLAQVPFRANEETAKAIGMARSRSAETKAQKKKESYTRALSLAKKDIGVITKRDLFILGIGIYIGEGSKTNDSVRVVNSDARIIRCVLRWFVEVCGISHENITARIHLYPSNNEQQAIDYWYKETGIIKSNFQKSSIDTRTNKKTNRIGSTPHGTLHVSVRANGNKDFGVAFSRRIGAWMDLMLEYGGKSRG